MRSAQSLPLRERGLKYTYCAQNAAAYTVAPLAGAWIEMLDCPIYFWYWSMSLPLRERGLKLK